MFLTPLWPVVSIEPPFPKRKFTGFSNNCYVFMFLSRVRVSHGAHHLASYQKHNENLFSFFQLDGPRIYSRYPDYLVRKIVYKIVPHGSRLYPHVVVCTTG